MQQSRAAPNPSYLPAAQFSAICRLRVGAKVQRKGGVAIKRILRSRLPERFADRVPALFVEIAVALIITGLLGLLRIAIVPFAGDRAPYALVFLAVVGATVFAGWRSGLLAIAICQFMSWTLVVEPVGSGLERSQLIGGLGLATFAQLVVVVIIALYQREVDRAWSQREEQIELIRHALAEIDHRTANNYQTVLALVSAQSRSADAPVKAALQQVSDRIRAIAMASKQLAVSSGSLEQVRLDQHLGQLCKEIGKGLTRPGIEIKYDFEDIELGADETVWVSILVNELVTNALKHAFPDEKQGVIRVALRRAAGGLALAIEDNGSGMKRGRRAGGLGTRLVQTFIKQLGADHQLETGPDGTRHRILFPAGTENIQLNG